MRSVYFRGRGTRKILHAADNCATFWAGQSRGRATPGLPYPCYRLEARRLLRSGWRICKRCGGMR